MSMNYTGITVTENEDSAADTSFIKIANGVHDILPLAANGTMTDGTTVKLTSVTVDTTNYVISGYDAAGTRYIVDKNVKVALTLV